jgi:hypothetical protein
MKYGEKNLGLNEDICHASLMGNAKYLVQKAAVRVFYAD